MTVPNPASRLLWLKIITAGALSAAMLLSLPLWLAARNYPTSPVSQLLPNIPGPLDAVWLCLILLLLGTIIVLSAPRRTILASVGLIALLCLWDQARWQPWLIQYLVILVVLSRAFRTSDNGTGRILDSARVLVASIYIWSGIHKMNATFVRSVFPWLLESLVGGPLAGLPRRISYAFALLVPVLEAGTGVALLTGKLRLIAVWISVAMHAFILLALGPLGHNWDRLVWPWNMAMPLLVLLLFWRTDVTWRPILRGDGSWFHRGVVLLCGVMPLLSFMGKWDSLLSWELYSGRTMHAHVEMRESAALVPAAIRRYLREDASGKKTLDPFWWSLGELNVEPYPEERVYRAVGRYLCDRTQNGDDVVLVLRSRPGWLDHKRVTTRYHCDQLRRPVDRDETDPTADEAGRPGGRVPRGRRGIRHLPCPISRTPCEPIRAAPSIATTLVPPVWPQSRHSKPARS